jgi:hypothetical protein
VVKATTVRRVFVLLLLLAHGAPLYGQQPDTAGAARIDRVRFSGIRALDPALVRDVVVTRESRCRSVLLAPVCAVADARWMEETAWLDPAQVERDEERIRSLYAAWGYPDTAVRSEVVALRGGDVEVRFAIGEGEAVRVRAVEFRGLDAIPEPVALPDPLPLRAGEPFAEARVEATRRRIASRLAELGYAFANIEVAATDVDPERMVDVVVEVRPGRPVVFGPTVVLPGPPISVDDVERRLAYRPGERFRPSALEHTAERLYRLPIVARVFIDPLPALAVDTVVVTTLGVTPGRVQGLQFGGAFSTVTCLEGTLGWGHRYLFGGPRTFSLNGGASRLLARQLRRFPCWSVGDAEFEELDYVLGGELREPLGADSWLQLGGAVGRESSPFAHIRRGVQARIGVVHQLTRTWEGSLAYVPERRDLIAAGPLFCGLHGVCDAAQIGLLGDDATLAPLELSLAWTPPLARRPPTPPPPGPAWMHDPLPPWLFTARVTTSAAAPLTGSGFSFGRVVMEGTAVRGRGRGAELAARLRFGALGGAGEPLPPHVRLFGGGPLGVRGVAANLLGPLILTATPQQVAGLGCVPEPGGCEGVAVDRRHVQERPTGGRLLAETSLEGRAWVGASLQLAAFLDYGVVQSGAHPLAPAAVARSERVWAPGLGVLALTPFGPVRADVAYNPAAARRYPLLMAEDGRAEQLHLGNVVYDPFRFGDPSPLHEFWRRLQFQLALGLPF